MAWTEVFVDLQIRRGFTVFQLMTILEESHHSLIFVEHDPMLYEDAQDMPEYVSLAQREAAKEAAVMLYAPYADPYFEELVKNVDRVFYFDEGPRGETKIVARGNLPRITCNRYPAAQYSHLTAS